MSLACAHDGDTLAHASSIDDIRHHLGSMNRDNVLQDQRLSMNEYRLMECRAGEPLSQGIAHDRDHRYEIMPAVDANSIEEYGVEMTDTDTNNQENAPGSTDPVTAAITSQSLEVRPLPRNHGTGSVTSSAGSRSPPAEPTEFALPTPHDGVFISVASGPMAMLSAEGSATTRVVQASLIDTTRLSHG